MTTTWTDHLIASTLALSLLGCNQPPPPGSDDSETSTDGSETESDRASTRSSTAPDGPT
jgi:hypothetical protein